MKAQDSSLSSGKGTGARVWSSLKSAVPRSDLPGAQQPTPWGLNRYVILLIYLLYVFLTGCVYFGWASLSSMLLKAQSFSALCPKDADGRFIDDMTADKGFICDEQEAAVQHLYTITLAVHTTFSSVAGTMMDFAGPLMTAFLGQLFNFTGWALLASSETVGNSALYAGFVFIGMGADMGFLPVLCITRLFPGSAGLNITLLGSAASASFAIPLILEAICKSLNVSSPRNVFWAYAGMGPGLCLLFALLFIPRSGYIDFRDEEDAGSTEAAQGKQSGDSPAACQTAGERAHGDSRCAIPGASFWRQLFSAKYIVLTIYFVGVGWASSFYQEAHNRLLSVSVRNFLKILLPLSFLPCIMWGYLADKWGILRVIFITNITGLLMYLFTFSDIEVLGYLSVLCFTNYMSIFTSQVFVYIEQHFTYDHFGKLIGIIQMVGGLFSLACNPLYSGVALNPDVKNGLGIVQGIMVGLLCLQFVWITVLFFLGKRGKGSARQQKYTIDVQLTNPDLSHEPQSSQGCIEDALA
ncbi:uncharacterized protein LOC34618879 [Cyclospora cayetanensis]|uniref:Uncharacterized protein n=2 Tax=Cyclospora cayetanensis TaxID=88456 RepID=A0A1D3CVS1_9EIME|nr:uncharacterized protein LOC34618879 [Cyclospora cayetanensis]OEH75293.1 hypothetical protein cyc_01959 [Cyclospora cayetanensis]